MTYINNFLRLVIIGRLFGAEDFSFSMSLIGGPVPQGGPPASVPPFIEQALRSYISGTTGLCSLYVDVKSIKLNEIGTDGRYTQDETVEQVLETPLKGNGSVTPAPQVSLVTTLRTASSRGRAHAGRYYLPLPGFTPDASGRISVASALDAANAAAGFLDAINTGFAGEYVVGVTSNIGTGTEREVTGVAVGRVLDTIRSRRSSLDEDYQEVPLP